MVDLVFREPVTSSRFLKISGQPEFLELLALLNSRPDFFSPAALLPSLVA